MTDMLIRVQHAYHLTHFGFSSASAPTHLKVVKSALLSALVDGSISMLGSTITFNQSTKFIYIPHEEKNTHTTKTN